MQTLWRSIRINFWGGNNKVIEIVVRNHKWTKGAHDREIEV